MAVTNKDSMTLEINGLHVRLTFTPLPASDTLEAIQMILKNSYIRALREV